MRKNAVNYNQKTWSLYAWQSYKKFESVTKQTRTQKEMLPSKTPTHSTILAIWLKGFPKTKSMIERVQIYQRRLGRNDNIQIGMTMDLKPLHPPYLIRGRYCHDWVGVHGGCVMSKIHTPSYPLDLSIWCINLCAHHKHQSQKNQWQQK